MTVVKNISISDAVTGHIIYQRVYAWTTSSAFSNLGKLIEGFCKFSREVDDGGKPFSFLSLLISNP